MCTVYTKVNNNSYKFYAEGTHEEVFEACKDLKARARKKGFNVLVPKGCEDGIKILCCGGVRNNNTNVEIHICGNDRVLNLFKANNNIN